jgi:hypothetical protein
LPCCPLTMIKKRLPNRFPWAFWTIRMPPAGADRAAFPARHGGHDGAPAMRSTTISAGPQSCLA